MSRGDVIEEMSDLAEALFEIIEEEDGGGGDELRAAVIKALAHQNLFNIELVSALNALASGDDASAEIDSLVMNMKSVHKSLVTAISAWSDEETE
ncbi:MAG: hypothetical protein CMH13_10990 [Martelella sp.]|uniref:hypothetical protein n=1 Tax=unclassified Martelella TaxID=2629616 RepID=UPI000C4E578B|nr:hypothetical protein [Martelella sp.]MAU21044.1 hypothetical protein [Martelella sp.]|tara:strand:+ start:24 stop:308 length:285 start_codon:yes stop_codon:yes gene_type:complete